MERRQGRNSTSKEPRELSENLQRKIAENKRLSQQPKNVPDLTDFMNDMFFGTIKTEKKEYNLTGGGFIDEYREEDDDFESSTRSTSSRLTHEWLEEAKRMVASSPSRSNSPSKLVGSPRFAVAQPRHSLASEYDRRDPLSRSARRNRTPEGFSGQILSKTTTHIGSNSNSELTLRQQPHPQAQELSPASVVHKWFSNILKPPNHTQPPHRSDPLKSYPTDLPPLVPNQMAPTLPPRLNTPRKSRFQTGPTTTHPQTIPPLPATKRTFKTTSPTTTNHTPPLQDSPFLSPPTHAVLPVPHRRSVSFLSSDDQVLSPPRNLVESARRRSVSVSTCSVDRVLQKPTWNEQVREGNDISGGDINVFLKEQRVKIEKILSGEEYGKAKVVLSGPSNSTSSMVAAICYALLMENSMNNSNGGDRDRSEVVVAPVMSMRRGKMWKQRQAAWLFYNVGIDATAMLFSDEVDLETLMMSKQLSLLVVGQDILRTSGEVGSPCTLLTDNYCEHAYDLLQTPVLKKLLLAGILLDTHNLDLSVNLSMTRDTEAVRLLSVGFAPNYRNTFYDRLMVDESDVNLVEALQHNYGKNPNESARDKRVSVAHSTSERKPYSGPVIRNSEKKTNDIKKGRPDTLSPEPAKPAPLPIETPAAATTQPADASRGKNKFNLPKWFGFGR